MSDFNDKEKIEKWRRGMKAKGFIKVTGFGWVLRDRIIRLNQLGVVDRDDKGIIHITETGARRHEVSTIMRYLAGDIPELYYKKGYTRAKEVENIFKDV